MHTDKYIYMYNNCINFLSQYKYTKQFEHMNDFIIIAVARSTSTSSSSSLSGFQYQHKDTDTRRYVSKNSLHTKRTQREDVKEKKKY